MATAAATGIAVRALARDDLDAVVAIDAAIEGRPRRDLPRTAPRRRAARTEAARAARGDRRQGPRRLHTGAGAGRRVRPHRARTAARDRRRAPRRAGPRRGHGALRRTRRVGTPPRDPRLAHAGLVEGPRDAALAGRDGIRARAESHRRLRGRGRPVHAGARRPGDDPRGRRARARDRLRRAIEQSLRAARARHGRRARRWARPISRTSSTSTAGSPAATGRRTCSTGSTRRWWTPAIRVSLTARLDGNIAGYLMATRRSRRLRPHRAGGGHRHDRRRSRLCAPRRRPRAALAAVRESRCVADRAGRDGGRAARPRSAGIPLRRRLHAVAAHSVRAPSGSVTHALTAVVNRPKSTDCPTTTTRARSAAPGRGPRGRHEHRRPRPRLRDRSRRRARRAST